MRTSFEWRQPRGKNGLVRRDMQVLRAAASGMGVADTARRLNVSRMWVKKVRRRIRFQLGIPRGTSFKEVVRYAKQHGII